MMTTTITPDQFLKGLGVKSYIVRMESEVYGAEEFPYDTLQEAKEALDRLQEAAKRLKDGVERTFTVLLEIGGARSEAEIK